MEDYELVKLHQYLITWWTFGVKWIPTRRTSDRKILPEKVRPHILSNSKLFDYFDESWPYSTYRTPTSMTANRKTSFDFPATESRRTFTCAISIRMCHSSEKLRMMYNLYPVTINHLIWSVYMLGGVYKCVCHLCECIFGRRSINVKSRQYCRYQGLVA